MRRVFVALQLPETVQYQLETTQCGLPNVRWVRPENLHITLAFLGEVSEPALEDAHSALSAVQADAFRLTLRGAGQFGEGKPRAVWVGVEPSIPLISLQEKVETSLRRAGLSLKARKFHPHVTLARGRSSTPAQIGQYLERQGLFSSPEFSIKGFHLMESILKPAGPLYLSLADYPLA